MKEEERYNCKNCGTNISEKEMLENVPLCPACGKTEGWLSDPFFVGFDDE